MVYHNWLLLVRSKVTGETIDPDRVGVETYVQLITSVNPAGKDQSISSALFGPAVQPTHGICTYLLYLLLSYAWRFHRHDGRYTHDFQLLL